MSGLAKKYSTTVNDLLKANPSIKNPNLIYSGSSLAVPDAPPQPVAPVSTGSAPAAPVTPTLTVTERVDQNLSPGTSGLPANASLYGANVPTATGLLSQYRKELGLDTALKSMQDSQSSYLTTLQNLPKKSDIYRQERSKLGLDTLQTNLTSLDDRLATMEEAINKSETDIRDRITQSGGLVTESQVQRMVASEKNPLIDEYRQLLEQRNNLAQKIQTADTQAKDVAGMEYEDASMPLTAAEKTMGFQKDQYAMLGDILSQVYGASEKDIQNILDSAKYGKEQERQQAQDVIDRALKLAQLANETPAGKVLDVAGTKVIGLKPASGSATGVDANDVESYALELLNNPNFTIDNVPQAIRAKVLQKRDEIKNQAASASTPDTILNLGDQPHVTAQQFGKGLKEVFTKQIPGTAKTAWGGTKGFFSGLFGGGQ